MSLLLDTHVVMWWLDDDPTLAGDIKDRLDQDPNVYVSAATAWEVSIKQALGKLGPPDLPEKIRDSGSSISESPPTTGSLQAGCRCIIATPSTAS